jgi:hypothetical protein
VYGVLQSGPARTRGHTHNAGSTCSSNPPMLYRWTDTGTPGQRTQQPCPKRHSPQADAAASVLSVRHCLHASRQQPPLRPHPGRADRLSREPSARGAVGPLGC